MGVRVNSSANAPALVNIRMPAALDVRNPRRLQKAHSAARFMSLVFIADSFRVGRKNGIGETTPSAHTIPLLNGGCSIHRCRRWRQYPLQHPRARLNRLRIDPEQSSRRNADIEFPAEPNGKAAHVRL